MVAQSIVNEFCRSGAIERSIETVKDALRERATSLCAALARELPDARFVVPDGRLLPVGGAARRQRQRRGAAPAAAERGVVFVKGTDFLLEGGDSSLRIAYSGVRADQIDEGVSRLADAYRELAGART